MFSKQLLIDFTAAAEEFGLHVTFSKLNLASIKFDGDTDFYAYCWLPTNKWGEVTHKIERAYERLQETGEMPRSMIDEVLNYIERIDYHLEFGHYRAMGDSYKLLIDEYLMSKSAQAKTKEDIVELLRLMHDPVAMEKHIVGYKLIREEEHDDE